jgi:aspartyl-tRNA(Asn)/glutamyl-tRNA(Gln) amidotransferase subunit C
MELTRKDVDKVALLARLRLSEEEIVAMTCQLAAIVSYVGQLSEANTAGVEPMAHVEEVANVFREDVVAESLPVSSALANAPKQNGVGYLVPAVFGDA